MAYRSLADALIFSQKANSVTSWSWNLNSSYWVTDFKIQKRIRYKLSTFRTDLERNVIRQFVVQIVLLEVRLYFDCFAEEEFISLLLLIVIILQSKCCK